MSSEDERVSEPAMVLGALGSPTSRRQVQAVVDAYAHFWAQPRAAPPPCEVEEVMDLLHRAAACVVYIRRHLDREEAPKPRVAQGGAHEFLWQLDYCPRAEPERFVRDLVHATLRDAGGYVEDLTEQCVDEFLAEIQAQAPPAQEGGAPRAVQLVGRLQELVERGRGGEGLDVAPWPAVCRHLEAALQELDAAPLQPKPAQALADPVTSCAARLARKKAKRQRRKRQRVEAAAQDGAQPPAAPPAQEQEGPPPPPPAPEPTPDDAQVLSDVEPPACSPPEGEAQPPAEDPGTPSAFAITIGKVGADVAQRRADVLDLLEASQALGTADPDESAERLQQLQKRCSESSEYLMRDMLALDALVAANPEERARRKEQIAAIQGILDSLDVVGGKLRALATQLREHKEALKADKEVALAKAQEEASERAREAPEPAGQVQALQERQQQWERGLAREGEVRAAAAQRLGERLEHVAGLLVQEGAWRKVRMAPRFEVAEQPRAYTLRAYIPDMRHEDISVDLDEAAGQLVVSGSRVPPQAQVVAMLDRLATALRSGRVAPAEVLELPDEELLLLVGAGRYGSFVQRFALPEDADPRAIRADYERGLLLIAIPKAPLSLERLFPRPRPRPPAPSVYPLGRVRPAWPAPGLDALFW